MLPVIPCCSRRAKGGNFATFYEPQCIGAKYYWPPVSWRMGSTSIVGLQSRRPLVEIQKFAFEFVARQPVTKLPPVRLIYGKAFSQRSHIYCSRHLEGRYNPVRIPVCPLTSDRSNIAASVFMPTVCCVYKLSRRGQKRLALYAISAMLLSLIDETVAGYNVMLSWRLICVQKVT